MTEKEYLEWTLKDYRERLIRHYGQLTFAEVRQVNPYRWEGIDKHGRQVRIGYDLAGSTLSNLNMNNGEVTLRLHIKYGDQWVDVPPIPVDGLGESGRIASTEQLIKFLADNVIPDGVGTRTSPITNQTP